MNVLNIHQCTICKQGLPNSERAVRSHLNAHIHRGELKEVDKRETEKAIFATRNDELKPSIWVDGHDLLMD